MVLCCPRDGRSDAFRDDVHVVKAEWEVYEVPIARDECEATEDMVGVVFTEGETPCAGRETTRDDDCIRDRGWRQCC